MLNVPELERRWKKYRVRKHFPIITLLSLLIIVSGILLVASLNDTIYRSGTVSTSSDESHSSTSKPTVSIVNKDSAPERTSTQKPIAVIEQKKQSSASSKATLKSPTENASVKLQPSMAFLQSIENDVLDYYFQDNTAASTSSSSSAQATDTTFHPALPAIHHTEQKTFKSENPLRTSQQYSSKFSTSNKQTMPVATASKMHIQRDNDMKDIQDVIKRFKKNKNPALSLFVAKRYYKIGNYQQAYNYALITNDLDNNIEDSWLIFAKSLYHLNQKDMAKKTLRTYLNDSGSVKAKITLEQMENGSFE